jgi:amino acid transporter
LTENRLAPARGFGLLEATALNMSNMVGVGPFITIPLIIGSMGGPQCMLGWLLGAVLALCDGLVWSELASAMPGSGGTYLYLREAFRKTRWGGILPFLFIWQFILSGPLEIASGSIGFSQYAGYLWRGMTPAEGRLLSMAVGAAAIVLLYRGITAVGRLTVVLWIGMLATVLWIVASGVTHFNTSRAFDFPPGAFSFSTGFFAGLGSAMLIAMYDFMGYYDVCYVGGEVRNPERTLPRSIVYSVLAIAAIYLLMNVSIVAVIPWREAMRSKFIAAEFVERLQGPRAATVVTILVLWTAFASVFALLLGYSRIPYAAAAAGDFFPVFARLHPRGKFPHVSLLVLGILAMLESNLSLDAVISALLTSRILIQFIGQIAALHHLRKHRPEIIRPFRMWWYPLPSMVAMLGWMYIFLTSGWRFVGFGLLGLLAGAAAYAAWRCWFPGTGVTRTMNQ